MSESTTAIASDERYRRMFLHLPVAAWEADWSEVLAFCRAHHIESADAFDERALATSVHILEANAIALGLAGAKDVEGFARVAEMYRLQSADRFAAAAGALLFGGKSTTSIEVDVQPPGGERLTLLLHLSHEGGWSENARVLTIAVDVTQRKRAEERFRRLFNNVPVAVWEIDWSGMVAYLRATGVNDAQALAALDASRFHDAKTHEKLIAANPAALALMGARTPEEHERWRDTGFPPDSTRRLAAAIAPMIFGDALRVNVEMRLRRLSGDFIDALIYFARAKDWERDATVIAAAIDITEAKRAERALLGAKAYVDRLIDDANVMIVEIDLQGRARRLNRMGEEVTGYTLEELRDRNWFETLSPPERREQARFYLTSLQQGHMPHSDENALVTRDGETRMIAWRNTDIYDSGGALMGIISFGVDVTDRKRAEEEQMRLQRAMLRSAEEWRLTFDAVNTPILITDSAGVVARANRAARDLAGRPFSEIVGCAIGDIRGGEPWQTAAELLRTNVPQGRATTAERKVSGYTWDISVARFLLAGETAWRFIVVMWEITSIVELQESLRRSETMSAMGSLVAGVAHEVRNPLFGISATLDAYHEELSRPGYQEFNDALRREVNRMTILMRDLLEYGRAPTLQIAPGHLREVVESAIHRVSVPQPDVLVENAVPADLPAVPMDETRLRQVFENLIDNATQHAPPQSRVTVSAELIERGGRRWVEARVNDSGPGFAASDFERVFEPFFTTRSDGIGLGLSIVQRVVQEHGGQVTAANRPEGGAVVAVQLPV